MPNHLEICLQSSSSAPQPHWLEISLNNSLIAVNQTLDGPLVKIGLELGTETESNQIKILKKVDDTIKITLETVTVDGSVLPSWLLHEHSFFQFDQSVHQGSREWYPAGVWQFEFRTPMLTWILDQKISHEAKYSQDYLLPWAYKLGPDSVRDIGRQIDDTLRKIEEIL